MKRDTSISQQYEEDIVVLSKTGLARRTTFGFKVPQMNHFSQHTYLADAVYV